MVSCVGVRCSSCSSARGGQYRPHARALARLAGRGSEAPRDRRPRRWTTRARRGASAGSGSALVAPALPAAKQAWLRDQLDRRADARPTLGAREDRRRGHRPRRPARRCSRATADQRHQPGVEREGPDRDRRARARSAAGFAGAPPCSSSAARRDRHGRRATSTCAAAAIRLLTVADLEALATELCAARASARSRAGSCSTPLLRRRRRAAALRRAAEGARRRFARRSRASASRAARSLVDVIAEPGGAATRHARARRRRLPPAHQARGHSVTEGRTRLRVDAQAQARPRRARGLRADPRRRGQLGPAPPRRRSGAVRRARCSAARSPRRGITIRKRAIGSGAGPADRAG